MGDCERSEALMRVGAAKLRSMGFDDAEFFVSDPCHEVFGIMPQGRAWAGGWSERGVFFQEFVVLELDQAVELIAAKIREQRDRAGES